MSHDSTPVTYASIAVDGLNIAYREAGHVVTRPPDGNQQVLLSGEIDCLGHVIGAGTLSDERRSSIDGGIEHAASGIVLRISRNHQFPLKAGFQVLSCGRGDHQ